VLRLHPSKVTRKNKTLSNVRIKDNSYICVVNKLYRNTFQHIKMPITLKF
jgi:hypothetical protein